VSDKILGYDFADIQRAQQGGRLHTRMIDATKPAFDATLSDADRALIDQYKTADALSAAGFHGVAERLRAQA
jgi:hypothetical protein